MDIVNLPYDIFPDEADIFGPVIIHDYVAEASLFRGKSVLHRNAISLVVTGEKTMHFANHTLNIVDDSIHFLSAGNCVANINLSEKKIFRSILMFFDDRILADFFDKHAQQVCKVNNQKKSVAQPFLSFKKDAFICNYIRSLEVLCQNSKPISQAMRFIKFEELMLHLLDTYPAQLISFQVRQGKDFNDIELRKVVETHINTLVRLEDLAFLCNTSLSTFKRRFVKTYEMSPSKWFSLQRMQLAKTILLQPNVRPSDIYWKVGYENHSSFTKSFKQTFGVTPSVFQTSQQNKL